MARFFFHVHGGDGPPIEDPEGGELPDLDAARAEALAAARGIVAEDLLAGRPVRERRFEIEDAAGRVLATVAFRDALAAP